MTRVGRVLVYGLGRSGSAAARLLRRQGHEVLVFDAKPRAGEVSELEALGCVWAADPAEAEASVCIAAPGVPWDHPHLQRLRDRGLETIGEVEWVYRSVDADIIGVTGTAGKGTVTRWISDTLTAAGVDAPAGGNIDPPLAAVARDGATLVVELSSFQLERCPRLRPRVAVALNLHVDHLDRHGTVEAYHAAKRKLIANLQADDAFVYNADDAALRAWAEDCPAQARGFSLREAAAAHLDGAGDMLVLHGAPLLHRSELRQQAGPFVANALAVALACAARGLPAEAIRAGLRAFQGLPGRYSAVGVVDGVAFLEDSIATRTLSVAAALEATPAPVVWIAGGVDKGASFDELRELVRVKVSLFIGVGSSGASFAREVAPLTETRVLSEPDGETALRQACRLGLEHLQRPPAGPGGTRGSVLLAPLAASFDQFTDYKARAEAFRRAVAELEASWTLC